MITLLLFGGILCCILLEAFFSGSEMAIISMDKIRLKTLVNKGSLAAKQIAELLRKPEWLLGTTLLGTNTATVMSTTLATYLVMSRLGQEYEFLVILIMSPIILIFAEIIPKTMAHARAEQISLRCVPIISVCRQLLQPVVRLLVYVTGLVTGMKQFSRFARTPLMSREDLEFVLRSTGQRGGLQSIERKMIHRIFELKDTTVGEIMIPLIEVISVKIDAKFPEVIETILKHGVSRLPVYRDRIDHVVGVLLSADLLMMQPEQEFAIDKFLRPPLFIPTAMPVKDTLQMLKNANVSMAVVVDEYGGAVGIITAEDILEEVVGDIEDEYDPRRKLFKQIKDNLFLVDARIEIKSLRDGMGMELPEGEYETLGGFIIAQLKRIPKVGDTVNFRHYTFRVTKANDRAVEEVQILVSTSHTATHHRP